MAAGSANAPSPPLHQQGCCASRGMWHGGTLLRASGSGPHGHSLTQACRILPATRAIWHLAATTSGRKIRRPARAVHSDLHSIRRCLPGRGRVLPSLPGVLVRTQNFWGVPHSSTPLRTRPAQLPQSPATMSRRSRRMQPLPVSPSRCKIGALVRDPCTDILAILQHQMARAWKPRRVSGDIR